MLHVRKGLPAAFRWWKQPVSVCQQLLTIARSCTWGRCPKPLSHESTPLLARSSRGRTGRRLLQCDRRNTVRAPSGSFVPLLFIVSFVAWPIHTTYEAWQGRVVWMECAVDGLSVAGPILLISEPSNAFWPALLSSISSSNGLCTPAPTS